MICRRLDDVATNGQIVCTPFLFPDAVVKTFSKLTSLLAIVTTGGLFCGFPPAAVVICKFNSLTSYGDFPGVDVLDELSLLAQVQTFDASPH